LDFTEVSSLLHAASHLILFSTHEGMPNVVLEGLSHGVFPIVTSMGGLSEEILQSSSVGIIVDEGDLDKHIDVPDVTELEFKLCRQFVCDNFAMQKIASFTYAAYLKAILLK
jgi:glycosyltransferase involved in cell wall biosynthesis